MTKNIEEIEEAIKIKFPCTYPVKVMGLDVNDFSQQIIQIIRRHAPDLRDQDISFRPSSGNKYMAVNVIIMATGIEQLEALFDDLKASGRVALVL